MSGLAMGVSAIYQRYQYLFWMIAGIVIFSRVYIGVHYPSDVILGCIMGSLFGFLVIKCWEHLNKNKF